MERTIEGPPPFSRRLLTALLGLRDGDFSVRLPSDLTGVDGKIADVFNEVAVGLLKSARDAGDEAERQSRLKDDFLATLSHELRTPMNVILGWLDILLSGKPIRDLQSTLALIQHNARLQAKLIDDLLDMNRLMAGDVRLEITSVDVGATLQATTKALQPSVDAKNIDLRVRLQSPPIEVQADGRLIQQVLWNLLHNAIKFTPDGGRVDASVERLHDEVRIAVQDTGRGISPSFLPYVFERFRQEDPSTTRESFGLGLGLSIAKRLVEVHGGSITADSGGPGQGSTFSIRLPIVRFRSQERFSPAAPRLDSLTGRR